MGIGKKRDRKPARIVRRVPESPRQPIPDSPFPENKGFHLGQFRVTEEYDDYIVCVGFDPNAKNPFAEITPEAFRTIKVAKPPGLQRTVWEAGSVEIDGVTYTYEYSDTEFGVRTVHSTNGDVEERIYPPYILDDVDEQIIVPVEIRKNAGPVEGMEVTDENGTRLRWIDLNVSGRHWKGPGVGPHYAVLTTDLAEATNFLTGAKTCTAALCEENPASPANLRVSSTTITITNRWVDLSLTTGKHVIVERIGDEWAILASDCP